MSEQLATSTDPHHEFEMFCHALILDQVRKAFENLPRPMLRGMSESFDLELTAAILGKLFGTRVLRRPYDFGRPLGTAAGPVPLGPHEVERRPIISAIEHGAMQRKPIVGNIVHFAERIDCSPVAAIVTGIEDSSCESNVILRTFPVASGVGATLSHVPFSEVPRPGHWSWPARI